VLCEGSLIFETAFFKMRHNAILYLATINFVLAIMALPCTATIM